MKTLSILFAASILVAPAWATNNTPTPTNTQSQQQGQQQAQGQIQGQLQGQVSINENTSTSNGGAGGGAVATSGDSISGARSGDSVSRSVATNGDQTTNITHESPEYRDRVPDPASVGLVTGSCYQSYGFSATAAGGGLSWGKVTLDEGCDARMASQLADKYGEEMMRYELLCLNQPGWLEADENTGRNQCRANQDNILAQGTIDMQPKQIVASVEGLEFRDSQR